MLKLATFILVYVALTNALMAQEKRIIRKLNHSGFVNTGVKIYPDGYFSKFMNYTHKIDLNFVNTSDSGWSHSDLEKTIFRAAEIYAQCELQFRKVTIVSTKIYKHSSRIEMEKEEEYDLVAKTLVLQKPIIYFVKELINKITNINSTGFSFIERTTNDDDIRRNTSWLTGEILSEKYQSEHPTAYNTLAHELGHLIGNLYHIMDGSKNLMSVVKEFNDPNTGKWNYSYDLLNGDLTKTQCKAILESKLVTNK